MQDTLDALRAVSVDDNEVNLILVESLAEELGLPVSSFLDPLQALEHLRREPVDLVFVDYMMPDMDGITFIRRLREIHPDIPVVMITAVTGDEQVKIGALEAGATEFLNKPLGPTDFIARVRNLARLRRAQLLLRDRALLLEDEVRAATATIARREMETLGVIGRAAEFKDTETGNHIRRVANYVRILAEELALPREQQDILYHAAPLHDVGKVGIPDGVLLKPGRLTPEEFEVMQQHTLIGSAILAESDSVFLRAGAEVARAHHEKYDGSGYPAGLAGENIPISGRIVAVADVLDALTSRRPYKEPWPLEQALAYLVEQSGRHFDPVVVSAFQRRRDEIIAVHERYQDEG